MKTILKLAVASAMVVAPVSHSAHAQSAPLESAARNAKTTKDPDTRRVGMFYASCMDSAAARAMQWSGVTT